MDSTVSSSTTTTARQRRPFSSTSTHQHASSRVPSHQDHTTTSNTTTAPTTPPTSSSTTSSSRLTASLTLSLPPSKSPFYYPLRLLTLFTLGFLFSIIIDHLQQEHNITRYPVTVNKWFSTASWVPLCCGFSGCLVGTVYPWMDLVVGERPGRVRREWSSVIRCCGGFIGVNYAASKLPWTSNLQVSITLALLALGLWFLFDRTWHGFLISSVFSFIGTCAVFILVQHGAYSITNPDFFGVRSWFPCILYSSSVCFGAIGRQLAVIPYHHPLERKQQFSTRRVQ